MNIKSEWKSQHQKMTACVILKKDNKCCEWALKVCVWIIYVMFKSEWNSKGLEKTAYVK
jgi:hypothetical protein